MNNNFMQEFNVTEICVLNLHYMVEISEKVEQIYKLDEEGFCQELLF